MLVLCKICVEDIHHKVHIYLCILIAGKNGLQLAAIEQAGAVFPRFEAAFELGLTLVEVSHPVAAANGRHDGRADLVGVNQGWVFTVLGLKPDFPKKKENQKTGKGEDFGALRDRQLDECAHRKSRCG